MDKKTLLGLLFIGVILVGWWIIMKPSAEEVERERQRTAHIKDSIAEAKRINDSIETLNQAVITDETIVTENLLDTLFESLPDSLKALAIDSIRKKEADSKYGPFSPHASGNDTYITVETDKFLVKFDPLGGRIGNVQLKNYHNYKKRYNERVTDTLNLYIDSLSGYNLTLFCQNRQINTAELYFDTDAENVKITGEDSAVIKYKLYANQAKDQYIEFSYTLQGNNYMIDFDIHFVKMDNVLDANQSGLPFSWYQVTPSQEREVNNERTRSNIFYKADDEDIYRVKRGGGPGKKKIEKEVKWISFKQQFFSTALIAKDGFTNYPFPAESAAPPNDNPFINMAYSVELAIPYGYSNDETFAMQMYMGPNHYNTLKKYKIDLEDQIDLGAFWLFSIVNKYLIIPVFNFFDKMHLGYGLIILLLTLIIKLILSPITYKTFVSSAKMRILKPDIDILSEKFKPEQAMEKQQAIMQLYRRAGVSPLAGCIPALLQMPILLAMFSFFPAAIELRQQGFLWATDLSSYDSILQLPFKIPFYGDHVSLFTILMTVTTMIYTSMSNSQMSMGGMQAKQMKIMMYLMPVLFLGILNNYSSALSYYYFLSNVVSILLTLAIRRFFINEDKLRLVIEENKKRPVKKSKWQQRVEDMQKVRQEQARMRSGGGKKK
ncbi:MAG: membrane protein insertase YidC [Flavobacteriales bacterium]|nr:membrane protein insertase YidC [Flavobacteriales bacterium]